MRQWVITILKSTIEFLALSVNWVIWNRNFLNLLFSIMHHWPFPWNISCYLVLLGVSTCPFELRPLVKLLLTTNKEPNKLRIYDDWPSNRFGMSIISKKFIEHPYRIKSREEIAIWRWKYSDRRHFRLKSQLFMLNRLIRACKHTHTQSEIFAVIWWQTTFHDTF